MAKKKTTVARQDGSALPTKEEILAYLKSATEKTGKRELMRAFRIKGADIAIERGDGHKLRLVQWLHPFNPEPSYPPPINHIGINRIALLVPDVARAVRILKGFDVPFISEPAPGDQAST